MNAFIKPSQKLILAGLLELASLVGVVWCYAVLSITPPLLLAYLILLLPPLLVLVLTIDRVADPSRRMS